MSDYIEDAEKNKWKWIEEEPEADIRVPLFGGYVNKKCPYAKKLCDICNRAEVCSCDDRPGKFRISLVDGGIF